MSKTVLVWLRRDLRLTDNPAIDLALGRGERPIPVYIQAPQEEDPWSPGAASRWWLHHSLTSLDEGLRALGSGLVLAEGDSLAVLRRLAQAAGAEAVYWGRLYDPALRARDTRIKQALRADGLRCESLKSHVLWEPWELATADRGPYRVFSAFWRKASAGLGAESPAPAPKALPPLPEGLGSQPLADLRLLPPVRWDSGLAAAWCPGEPGALAALDRFIDQAADAYATGRDRPGVLGTSRLSAHLHFGEIAPRLVVQQIAARVAGGLWGPAEPFLRELGWREFAQHLLYHYPQTPTEPLDPRFARFPWREGGSDLRHAWELGRTGVPLVDAGMRELWHTGWMHNRVRMVVASLLTKNLRLPWQVGARWFWDTLVDADLAANTLGWQWTAGCGADAAPYFRVFNPVLQGERFDPRGDYVRRWCPELARLPDRYLHQPWTAPAGTLAAAGFRLGQDYPAQILDLAESRREALAAWGQIKGA